MSTTEKSVRAWVPAVVTSLLGAVLAVVGGLIAEILIDHNVDELGDPTSLVGSWVYGAVAPLGGPGIIGDRSFEDSILAFVGGLVLFVVVLFVFTWLASRGSALTALLGAWLGTILGAGLGALAAFEIFLRRNDLADDFFGIQQARVDRLDTGLYWGAVVGLLLGLVTMAVRAMATRSRSIVDPDEPAAPWPPPPADTSAFARPVDADPPTPGGGPDDTVVAPSDRDRTP